MLFISHFVNKISHTFEFHSALFFLLEFARDFVHTDSQLS